MTQDSTAPEIQGLMAAMAAGDAEPLAQAFARPDGPRGALMAALLAASEDAEVARAFDLIWQEADPGMGAAMADLLRWYLGGECGRQSPARRRLFLQVLGRVLAMDLAPLGHAGVELGHAAARVALEQGGAPGLRGAACRLLRRLDPGDLPVSAPLVHTAIHAVDLAALRRLIDRWPEGELPADLRRALNWGMGLSIEFGGIDPWMERMLERQFLRDPLDPLSAQRRVQLGLHRAEGFAGLAQFLQAIRQDPADPNLRQVLQFGLWQAQNISDDALTAHFAQALVALDPGWNEGGGGPALPASAPAFAAPPPGADLAALTDAALALAAADLRLDGAWQPPGLRAAFDALAGAAMTAPLPGGWSHVEILQAAQRLLQLDKREFSWITHFQEAPHAMGAPRFGLVDLRLIPAVHDGIMAVIAALCRVGVGWFLDRDPPGGLGPVARLVQLHGKASLAIGDTAAARAMIDRVAEAGLLPDVLAIEEDNLALALGSPVPDAAAPAPRQGSSLHPFLDRKDWSAAEDVAWQDLAEDAPVAGRFDVLWPDGRLEVADHLTPPGRIRQAALPGLALVSEDFLIGPRGAALRPDPYHTSAEFPWPNAVMVAAGRRAIRLRPRDPGRIDSPVLLLEAFEALRWRNYYHWMVPILSRIALALDQGLLEQRRLVVPEGLSGWMKDSLSLLGLTEDRLVTVPLGRKVQFGDPLLMSSVEHVSPACVAALRRRLLTPQERLAATAGGPALFLSRKGQKARRMDNEEAIEDLAADLGFQVVAPQDLGIAGQLRLFASARGVAAVEGAALTNTLFAPPGLRVLAMCCENDMMPIFNDLSIVLGHHHRKLAGHGMPVGAKGNRFQPPFRVETSLAFSALTWVLAGPDPAPPAQEMPR